MQGARFSFSKWFLNTHTRVAARTKDSNINIFYYLPESYETASKIVAEWKCSKKYIDIQSVRILAVIAALNFCSIIPLALSRYAALITRHEATEICANFGLYDRWDII